MTSGSSGQTVLPIASCDNCGVCCLGQGFPPGYDVVLINPKLWPIEEDVERVAALPAQLRHQLIDHLAGEFSASTEPCIWFDVETKLCRHHEHRPSICREFELGSTACLGWRAKFDV